MRNNASGEIDWRNVRRVLVVKLRSIGDTVLSTPSLTALRRFLPHAEVDVLLEDWVAPLLEDFDDIDNVIQVGGGVPGRLKTALQLHRRRYDVAINLHGGTTATFFTSAAGAKHRIGYSNYRYSFLYTHLLSSAADFWKKDKTHSAEQQLALLGFVGVPVADRPRSHLVVTADAEAKVRALLRGSENFALLHPVSNFATKRWSTEKFARTAEFLGEHGLAAIAVASADEKKMLDELEGRSKLPIRTFHDLTLPEITALAARARLFIGNDSGIAHIAAAVQTPAVVIFGSSNRDHWFPWTDAPSEMVFRPFACQPCPGYTCAEFGEPRCIIEVDTDAVFNAIKTILRSSG